MESNTGRVSRAYLLPAVAIALCSTGITKAQAKSEAPQASTDKRFEALEAVLRQQQEEIDALKQRLHDQDDELAILRGRGLGPQGTAPSPLNIPRPAFASADQESGSAPPASPVGAAPSGETEKEQMRAHVQAVPEGQGVLTPRGTLVIEPSVEYVQSATDRLVFRGVELVPGLQLGVIEASTADRNTVVATDTARIGLTNRLEAEVRFPWVYRHDTVQVVQQRDQGVVRSLKYSEKNIGDVEFALRYQLNAPKHAQEPIFVGSLRVKSDSGRGPFDISYDEFGIATGLATGSGFWAVQPGINFLLPSDPVVIYGSANYLINIGRDVNKTVGGAFVGHVSPGNAISANMGFGFALNPRFSFSLGYEHAYIFPTKTEIGGTLQKSSHLQVGSLVLGMSYRLTERQSMNWNFEFGVTHDAPDVAITLRLPMDFKL